MTLVSDLGEAQELESIFLGGLNEAQGAFERIMQIEAWTFLGFDNFAEWWRVRITPAMRSLSMRPVREITVAGIEQVRREDAGLPPSQRHTQREIGEMFSVDRRTVSKGGPQDRSGVQNVPSSDLEAPMTPEELALREQVENGEVAVGSLRERHSRLAIWAADHSVRIDRRTIWGNPFEMPADGDRDTVIHNYEHHYLPFKPGLISALGGLQGKLLLCWCAPEPCHGDVLKRWAER